MTTHEADRRSWFDSAAITADSPLVEQWRQTTARHAQDPQSDHSALSELDRMRYDNPATNPIRYLPVADPARVEHDDATDRRSPAPDDSVSAQIAAVRSHLAELDSMLARLDRSLTGRR